MVITVYYGVCKLQRYDNNILSFSSDLGQNIFIVLLGYNSGILSSFNIGYNAQQCKYSDWKMEVCSKSCGGGHKWGVPALLNPSLNTSSCTL